MLERMTMVAISAMQNSDAGCILWRLGNLPQVGVLTFEVVSMKERNIDKVRVQRLAEPDVAS